jgi:hypothetical protein
MPSDAGWTTWRCGDGIRRAGVEATDGTLIADSGIDAMIQRILANPSGLRVSAEFPALSAGESARKG